MLHLLFGTCAVLIDLFLAHSTSFTPRKRNKSEKQMSYNDCYEGCGKETHPAAEGEEIAMIVMKGVEKNLTKSL